jgi:uncharacterized membrane protein
MSGDRHQPSVAELDARLQRLEQLVERLVAGVSQSTAPIQSETISRSDTTPIPQRSRVPVKDSTHTTSPTTDAQSAQTTSGTSSAKFLGAVGVLCFVLAGSYFIKLAITEGWITPTMQLTALVVFALSLIFGGFVLRDSDSQYASLLPGTGVVLLYMAAYGGHLYFHLYDMSVATFVVNAVSLGALVLYSSFRQHFYALAASVGTYLVPLLLGGSTWSFFPLCVYVMVWNVTFSVIAASLGSRLLLGLTAYLAVFLVLVFGEQSAGAELHRSQFHVAVFQALQFFLFSVMIVWYSIRRREPLSNSEAWSFFPLLLLFYVSEYEIIQRLNAGLAPWCALVFGACVYGAYALAKKFFGSTALASYPMVSSFLSIVAVHAVYLELSPSFLKPWLAIAVLLYYARSMTNGIAGSPSRLSVYVLSFVPLIEYVKALDFPEPGVSATYSILLNFAFAAVLLFAAHEARAVKSSTSLLLGVLGALQFLLGLKYASELAFEPVTAAYVTSALWSATALVLLLVAQRLSDRALASKASWLFGLTAIKVLLFDLSESSTGGRIVALLVIGALFYAGGYVFRRIAQ